MKRGRLALPLVAAATLMLTAGAPPARKLGPTQKIKNYGYSIRAPQGWISSPPQPGETKIVGSWKPDYTVANRKGDYASGGAELEIVRYPAQGSVTGSRAAEKAKKKRSDREKFLLSTETAKSLDEYMEARFKDSSKRYVPKKIVAGRGKSKLTGEFMEFTSGAAFVCAARFSGYNWDWGIFYLAREDYYEKEWKKCFTDSLKSFKLFQPTGEVFSPIKGDLTPEQRRAQIKAGIAGTPGWWALDTDNYVFLTNSKKKGFIKSLGREIEVIRQNLYEKLFPPGQEVTAISIVRVFANEAEYYAYGGPGGSAGYWSSAKEELVLFDGFQNVSKAKSKTFTKAVMYHEAFHQYIFYAVGDVAPHSWFNEGHGDFFAGHLVKGKRVIPTEFEWRVKYLKLHATLGRGLIPIRSLVRLPQGEYYMNAGLKYSQGWALIYFLRNVTKNATWRNIPTRYFAHLRDNVAAFKKLKEKNDTEGESVEGIPRRQDHQLGGQGEGREDPLGGRRQGL